MIKMIKYTGLLVTLLVLFQELLYAQIVDAGPDTVMLKGSKITIGPVFAPETFCYSWSSDHPASISDKKAPRPEVSPEKTSTFKLTVVGPDFEFTEKDEVVVNVKETKVKFIEFKGQQYGFDGYGPNSFIPWKSVEKGKSDLVMAQTNPAGDFKYVNFASSDTLALRFYPPEAASEEEAISITAGKDSAEIFSRFNDPNGPKMSELWVKSYLPKTYRLGIVPIVEEDDDVMLIKYFQGLPYQNAILPGPDNILNTIPAGDDSIVGNVITTGRNGVCQTVKSGDDVQIIDIDKGAPNTVCLKAGPNGYLDSTPDENSDDMEINGDEITTGENGICETKPRTKNRPHSRLPSINSVVDTLNYIYQQAVINWIVDTLPACVHNFDWNRDGVIDISGPWMSSLEMQNLVTLCDVPGYDRLIFLVDNTNPSKLGMMQFYDKFGFVHANNGRSQIANTVSHELGHSLGLHHTFEIVDETNTNPVVKDPANLMHPYSVGDRLRKNQWDQINPWE